MSTNSDGSSAQHCAHEPNSFSASETRVYTCPRGMCGRYVRIRYPPTTPNEMELCEVQVQPGGGGQNTLLCLFDTGLLHHFYFHLRRLYG